MSSTLLKKSVISRRLSWREDSWARHSPITLYSLQPATHTELANKVDLLTKLRSE